MNTYSNSDYAALVLRLSSGVLFLAHGLLKVNVFTIAGTVAFFESLGLPALLAYLTIIAEIGGGIALILGVATRLVSAALIPVLLGATWVHMGNGWVFFNHGGLSIPMYGIIILPKILSHQQHKKRERKRENDPVAIADWPRGNFEWRFCLHLLQHVFMGSF